MSALLAIGIGALKIPVFVGRGLKTVLECVVSLVIHTIATFIVAPTAFRTVYSRFLYPDKDFACWHIVAFFGAGIPVVLTPIFFLACSQQQISGTFTAAKEHIPFFTYILFGFLATNVLSLCYELGRKKTCDVAKSETDDVEPTGKKDDGVSDFMTMFDSIRGFETISPEQVFKLYERIIELLGEKKITSKEAKKLHTMVQNGARANIA